MMFDIIAETKEEWRDLGFYYDFDKENTTWHLVGSLDGLSSFSRILREYADDERNNNIGEHEHLGPYMYLTIVTSESPKITDYGIFGSLSDLKRHSDLTSEKIKNSKPDIVLQIDTEYSDENEAILLFEIKNDGFDPSVADDFAWAKK